MPYICKVLWSRRRKRKQNKLFSIKYQSYHRHHLIRISSCHKLQRAKKTKKTKFSSKLGPQSLTRSQKVIEKIIAIHSSNPSKKKKANQTKNVPLKHAFNSFGKWCSFPQELFNVKNWTAGHSELAVKKSMPDDEKPNLNFYLTEEKKKLYTSPTSMLLVNNYFTKPAVFNIFVVKYNPVSQSTKLAFCIRH